jgi:DNA-binding transcriptional MerR regulator
MTASESAMRDNLRGYDGGSADTNLPVPDPTRLTTQLVDRTFGAFREVFEVRFAELDRAIALATSQVDRIPADTDAKGSQLRADVDRQVLALRELILSQIESIKGVNAEKFQALDIRFTERDVRVEQAARESRMSQDAALAAAKEAVAEQNKANAQAITKSELSTQKQIDAMGQLMTNSNKSLEDKIAELKTRLDRGEGRTTGSSENRAEKRLDVGAALQAIAVLATIIGLIIVAFRK